MSCLLTPEIQEALLKKIAQNFYTKAQAGEPLDLKNYTREIYDFFLPKRGEALALDAARLVPVLLSKAIHVSEDLRLTLKKADKTFKSQVDELFDQFEDDVNSVRSYLGLDVVETEDVVSDVKSQIEARKEEVKEAAEESKKKEEPKQVTKIPLSTSSNFYINTDNPKAKGYMQLRPEQVRNYNTQQKILGALNQQMEKDARVEDSSSITLPGLSGGVYIQVVNGPAFYNTYSKDIEVDPDKIAEAYVTLVDQNGNPILFSEAGDVSETGKVVFYSLKKDKANEEIINYVKNKNAFVQGVINSGSKGFIKNLDYSLNRINTINFSSPVSFTVETTAKTEDKVKTSRTVFHTTETGTQRLYEGNIDNNKALSKTIVDLFTADLYTSISGKLVPISVEERIRLLSQFIYLPRFGVTFVSRDLGGGNKSYYKKEKIYTLMIEGVSYDIGFNGDFEKEQAKNVGKKIESLISQAYTLLDQEKYKGKDKIFPINDGMNSATQEKIAIEQGAQVIREGVTIEGTDVKFDSEAVTGNKTYVVGESGKTKIYARVYKRTLAINASLINKKYNAPTISTIDGKQVVTLKPTEYNQFLKENTLTDIALDDNNSPVVVASSMTFTPTESQVAKATEPVREEVSVGPLLDEYKGKIVYATAGSGKTTLADTNDQVIDGDKVIIAIIKKNYPWFSISPLFSPQETIMTFANALKTREKDSTAYKKFLLEVVFPNMKEIIGKHPEKTIVTGSVYLIPLVDVVMVQKNPEIVREGFNKAWERDEINKSKKAPIIITKYISDVLTQTEEPAKLEEKKIAVKEEVEEVKTPDAPATQPSIADQSEEDIINNILNNKKALERNGIIAAGSAKATEEQIKQAKIWYEKSPLAKHFPFKVVLAATNIKRFGPVASWASDGIILYSYYQKDGKRNPERVDYTNLYHEAWHGFSQTFLTKEERAKLYAEVRKKTGSFVDYQGNHVSFKTATAWQLEEYLAEEFRSYMLSGGKADKATPVKNTLFRKLLNFLKELFFGVDVSKGVMDPLTVPAVAELFQKLSVGDISSYNFDITNRDQTIGVWNRAMLLGKEENLEELGYEDSNLVVKTIDSLISTVTNELIKKSGNHSLASTVYKNKQILTQVYKIVKIRLKDEVLPNLRKELSTIQDKIEYDNLNERIRFLETVIKDENFGFTDDISRNRDANTVLGYHLRKSKLISSQEKDYLLEDIDEVKLTEKGKESFERTGSESWGEDLGSPELNSLMRSLHYPDKKNILGVPQLIDKHEAWMKVAKITKGMINRDMMEEALIRESKKDPVIKELLEKLGPASRKEDDRLMTMSEHKLWTNFYQVMSMANITLNQMTVTKEESGEYGVTIGTAQGNDRVAINYWENIFRTRSSKYIKQDIDGLNYLDVELVVKDFGSADGKFLKADSKLQFLDAIGIIFTDHPEIRQAINTKNVGSVANIFARLSKMLRDHNKTKIYSLKDIFKQSKEITEKDETDKGMFSNLRELSALEVKYSDKLGSFAVTNAQGNTQYEQSLHNSISIIVSTINEVPSYRKLMEKPYMQQLNIEKNSFAASSTWLEQIFDLEDYRNGGEGFKKPGGLVLQNISGIKMDDNGESLGEASSSADEFSKLILDFHLTLNGKPELMRHADKSTSFSVYLRGFTSYINRELFKKSAEGDVLGYQKAYDDYFKKYIDAELKRIKKLNQVATQKDLKYDAAYLKAGQNFVIFESILPEGLRTELLSYNNLEEAITARPGLDIELSAAVSRYLEEQNESVTKLLAKSGKGFIDKKLLKDLHSKVGGKINEDIKPALIRAFTVNSWIHNFESMSLIYGDVALYNLKKEEFHKRNAGAGSTGNIFSTDAYSIWWANQKGRGYAKSQKLHEKALANDGSFQTAILKDNEIPSTYLEKIGKALVKADVDAGSTQARAEEKILGEGGTYTDPKKSGTLFAYKEMNEGDAQGWITFDFYRTLSLLEARWSIPQEEMYQKIIAGEKIEDSQVVQFFPVRKFQYWGPLATEENQPPLIAMHKFSLLPMIPSLIEGTNLEKLHKKMMTEGIDYATFKSGSKISTITKINAEGKAEQDLFYKKDSRELADETFVPNTVFLQFLKDQLEIAPEFKEEVTFPTQMRKLIENGLMEGGVPKDFMREEKDLRKKQIAWDKLTPQEKLKSDYWTRIKKYEANVRKLTELKMHQLKREANIKFKSDGTIEMDDKFRRFIINQLSTQDLAEHELDFIKVGPNGTIAEDFSISLSAEKLEKMLAAIVMKRLIRQKVNGEPLVQVSGAGFETLKGKAGGTNELPFYEQGEGDLSKKSVADIPQNKISGVESFGSLTTANAEAIKALGSNPHSIDMIEAGFRTRTTRSASEMAKYNIKVGDIVKHYGKSANGKTKTIYSRVTAIHPKGSAGWKGTWEKEGWDINNVDVIDRFKDGAAAIEFEVVKEDTRTKAMKVKIALQGDFFKLLYLKDNDGNIIGTRERLNEMLKDENWLNTGDHRKMISIIGPRIPVQGLNSMEFAEVYEFLPTNAGNIVILPSEIVAKAGSDFDIDKLTFLMPNISNERDETYWSSEAGKKRLKELAKENPELNFSIDNIAAIYGTAKEDRTPEDKIILKYLITGAKYDTGNTIPGLENAIMEDMRGILELEENYADLIRPNGTDIVKPLADKMSKYISETDFRTVLDEEGKPRIPGSRIFEVGYNLYKHASNNIGKQTLGLGAVDNTYNAIFNRIGAKLNKTYNYFEQERRITMLLDHNTLDGAISLSNLMDAENNNRISDVISQLMNGWVDIAKDAWVFNVQGNKEIAPVLLFMIQAGVPLEQAVYMVSHPLIRAYVNEQKLAKSTFAGPLDKAPESIMKAKTEARNVILTLPKYGFGFTMPEPKVGKEEVTETQIAHKLYEDTIALTGENGKVINFFAKDKVKDNLFNRVKDIHDEIQAGKPLSKTITDEDRAIFLHFLEIEKYSNAIRDVKLNTNLDTSRVGNVFEASTKDEMLAKLKTNGILPDDIVDKILEESPIGSFYIYDSDLTKAESKNFMTRFMRSFFKLRGEPVITDYLLEYIDSRKFRGDLRKTFPDDPTTFVRKFRNDLTSFIFQNYYNKFDLDKVIEKGYNGLATSEKIEVKGHPSLKHGAFVVKVDNKPLMFVDKAKLKKDYLLLEQGKTPAENAIVLQDGTVIEPAKLNPEAFLTEDNYYSFVFERETLRYVYSGKEGLDNLKQRKDIQEKIKSYKETLVKAKGETDKQFDARVDHRVYEEFLRDTALDNTYNMWKLFESKESMADQLTKIKLDYPELLEKYTAATQLVPSVPDIKSASRMTKIGLVDSLLDGDKINILNENIRELSDPARISITASDMDKKRIADFFKRLSVYAFLQSGMDTTGAYSLVRIVPQSSFTRALSGYTQDFIKNINTITLDKYKTKFLNIYSFKNKKARTGIKNYNISDFNPARDKKLSLISDVVERAKVEEQEKELEKRFREDAEGNLLFRAVAGQTKEGVSVDVLTPDTAVTISQNLPNVVFAMNGAIESKDQTPGVGEKALLKVKETTGNVVVLPSMNFYNDPAKDITDISETVAQEEEKKIEASTVDAFQYYGKMYNIKVVNGVGVDVLNVGKTTDKGKLLSNYNTNKDVDPQNGKRFRGFEVVGTGTEQKATDKNVVVPEGSSRNNLPIFEDDNNIYLMNDGQQAAYDKIKAFILDRFDNRGSNQDKETVGFTSDLNKEYSNVIPKAMWDNMIGLVGRGGVGKTTVIKKVIEDIKKQKRTATVTFAAPTHNAVTMLQEALGEDSEGTAGASTLASLVSRNQSYESDKKEPTDKGSGEDGLFLLSSDEYKKSLRFKNPISSSDIIIIDESSMVDAQFIKDLMFRFKDEGNRKMPLFIFMGDYRQLPPVEAGEDKVGKFKEGLVSATLFSEGNKDKFAELTQVMRSKDKDLHKVYDAVGNQITEQREDVDSGSQPREFDFSKYDDVTSHSTENMLVVNERDIDSIIDMYSDELIKSDDPYNMFWTHYNRLTNAKTQALFKKIRDSYFEKMGKESPKGIVTVRKGKFTKEVPEVYVGDFVQYTGNMVFETNEHKSLGIEPGLIKPTARFKVLDILETDTPLSKFNPALYKAIGRRDVMIKTRTYILFNRQGKKRAVVTPVDSNTLTIDQYNKNTRQQEFTVKDKDGNTYKGGMHYGDWKENMGSLLSVNNVFEGSFIPSYIGSTHTVQGASIKRIIVGDYNIRQNIPYTSMRDIESSLYTALTRAAKKLIIIKPNAVTVTTNQDVFVLEDTPQEIKQEAGTEEAPNTGNIQAEAEIAARGTVKEVNPQIDSSKKINIYAGTGENAELSNFAQRPVKTELGDFNTPEAAFQYAKSMFTDESVDNSKVELQITNSKTGADAKALGRQLKGLDKQNWDANSSEIMKDIIKKSFEQNPDALAKLLATGNATLTHMYKGVEQDKGRFSRLLMEVRAELSENNTLNDQVKTIDPAIKFKIDEAIKNLSERKKQGFEIAWPEQGVAQNLIGANPATGILPKQPNMKAKATFIYLSKKLYESFGYVNPNLDKVLSEEEIKPIVPSTQWVSDATVEEALRFCFNT